MLLLLYTLLVPSPGSALVVSEPGLVTSGVLHLLFTFTPTFLLLPSGAL